MMGMILSKTSVIRQYQAMNWNRRHSSRFNNIKAVSFDITGTILVHKDPVLETYYEAALWAKLPDPPSSVELKPAFKSAYYQMLLEYPCFGYNNTDHSDYGRDWWYETIKLTFQNCNRDYPKGQFDRCFRRIYQHFGCIDGYLFLDDAQIFLSKLHNTSTNKKYLGVTTNTPIRTIDTCLPLLGIHKMFEFFACCQEIGFEKPQPEIFNFTFEQVRQLDPTIQRNQVLRKFEYCTFFLLCYFL